MTDKGQFEQGHEIPVQHQEKPGLESKLGPKPESEKLPTDDEGYQLYKAAGKLEGKKAFITGGDSGIGRATAILFAMEGADSFIVYLPEEQEDAEETKKRVEKYGRKCHLFATDVKEAKNCKTAVDKAIEAMGKINILFNNAAFQQVVEDPIKDLTEEHWLHTFNTNIHPFWFLAKYVVPQMSKGDTIINNASINAYIGRPDLLAYTSTKGAITAFTRGLSNVLLEKGIRVNQIAPGPVWTPLVASTMSTEAQKEFTSPMGRPSQPSEIASCVVFLASADSSSVLGQTIHCNGGVIVNG